MEPGSRSSNTAERPASFEELVEEAAGSGLSGWNFSFLDGRWCEDDPSWDQFGRLRIVGALRVQTTCVESRGTETKPLTKQTEVHTLIG